MEATKACGAEEEGRSSSTPEKEDNEEGHAVHEDQLMKVQ